MWERMKPVLDGCIVVSLEETRQAMGLLAEKSRVIAEGAGALSVAAALTGKAGQGPIRRGCPSADGRSSRSFRAAMST